MIIRKHVIATTALSVLAACGSAEVVPPADVPSVDVEALLSKLGTYEATNTDTHTNTNTALRDASIDGVAGFLSFSDGRVEPVLVRMSPDSTKAFLSIGGGEEIELDITDTFSSNVRWTGALGEGGIFLDDAAPALQIFLQDGSLLGRGYYGIQSTVADLSSDSATYSGTYFMSGIVTESDGLNSSQGSITLNVNFSDKSLGGQLEGNLRLPSEFVPVSESDAFTDVFGNAITGEISGSVDGNQFAGAIDVSGVVRGSYLQDAREVTGALGMMGAFYSDGNTAAGAFAGTISETDMGGLFSIGRELLE